MNSKTVLILGAYSDIAQSIARLYSSKGYNLVLALRNSERLKEFAQDLRIRSNCEVFLVEWDLLGERRALSDSFEEDALPETAIVCAGYLGEQEKAEKSYEEANRILLVNFTQIVHSLSSIVNAFEKRGSGTIIGIASVAGLRGRGSNYYYGAAKSGFIAFLSGLRNRLFRSGIHVMTVIPGFVRTKMIKGINTPDLVTSSPKQLASVIYQAHQKRKDIVYSSWKWKLIMGIIRLIPETIFKRLSL